MMVAENLQIRDNQTDNVEQWFDKMVGNLRYDQALFDNDILEKGKREIYSTLISGNQELINHLGRQASSAFFITKIIDNYFKELIKTKSKPNKIALEMSDSKILVWAEINENDEVMEDGLILSQAKTNAEFSKYGFHISSTIVENTDFLDVPKHYKSVTIK